MIKKHGLAIAFDGPDGVGKSTQLALTAEWLESLGYKVFRTRSNGGTPIGEELRKVILSDHPRPALTDVYISLAMGVALAEELQKRVEAGEVCLIDRSPLAIVAYNTYGSELEDKTRGIDAMLEVLTAWQLDALVMFEADQTVIDQRRQARTDKPLDFYEKKSADFHQRVREGYQAGLEQLKQHPDLIKDFITIDASPDIGAIQANIRAELKKML